MISADSLSIEWVSSKIEEFKGDPIIVEKVIRVLTLFFIWLSLKKSQNNCFYY